MTSRHAALQSVLLLVLAGIAAVKGHKHEGEGKEEWYTCPKSPQAAYFHFYTPTFGRQETSVQVYETARWDELNWNCIAAMSEKYKDSFTSDNPLIRAPEGYYTARHRVSCTFFAMYETLPGFMPDMVEKHAMEMKEWGYEMHTSDEMRSRVRRCLDIRKKSKEETETAKKNCLQPKLDAIVKDNGHPLAVAAFVGSMVGHLHADFMKNDKMNASGMMGKNGRMCQKNCWRYRDTTGYEPVNTPNTLKDETKWQPLVETDNLGFMYAQEHVTPQVGLLEALTVPAEFMKRQVDAPNYDYKKLDMDPIKMVAALDGDVEKKMLIEYLDAKSQILNDIGAALGLFTDFSYEQKALWLNGYTGVEIDAVAVTWKEKIRHNAVRPTSRVQQAKSFTGVDEMTWYDGSTIEKEDWTPYIRVMPHAEYPSGSASICWSIADYVDAYMKDVMGKDSLEVTKTFKKGSSHVDPMLPEEEFKYTFKNMAEVAELCSESRLWGGMHYRPSIEASKGLVEGFGAAAYEWTKVLMNGDELPGVLEEDMPTKDDDDKPDEKEEMGGEMACSKGYPGRLKRTKIVDEAEFEDPCMCQSHCAKHGKAVAWTTVQGEKMWTCICQSGRKAQMKRTATYRSHHQEGVGSIRSGFL